MSRLTIPAATTSTGLPVYSGSLQNLIAKLTEYEDAEAQGLIVRLPCKVGDAVYISSAVVPKEVKTFDYQRILNRNGLYPFLKARVVSMRINARQKLLKLAVFATYDEKVYYQDYYQDITDYTRTEQEYGKFTYPFSVIGKTVFLTREEAERALKEAEK